MRSLEPQLNDFSNFSRHARAGAVMTLVGAVIIAGSLIYSGLQLAALQRERATHEEELQDLRQQLKNLNKSRDQAQRDLEQLQGQVRSARESLTSLQPCLKMFFTQNYVGAVDCYDRAIATDPANPVIYDLKGYSLLRAGQIDASVTTLEKSVSLAPDYVWGHYNLALAYWAAGANERAVSEVKKVLDIDPSFSEVIRRDGQFSKFWGSEEFKQILAAANPGSQVDG